MDGKHCILFGTHGGMPRGQFWSMSRNMIKKGMHIIGWGDWYGSDFMSPHAEVPDGEWGHPDEIDLAEAEAFGRKMVENSMKIHAGDRSLIPEIPTPEKGANSLWAPTTHNEGDIAFASPPPNSIPYFDLKKCVYPRCTQCIDNCPVNAIDLSVTAPAGTIVAKEDRITQDEIFAKPLTEEPDLPGAPLVLKEACQNCGGLCQRVCRYDAIAYLGEKIQLIVNTQKCTFPKCTECIDNCTQGSMDFSNYPDVVVHNHCEAEGLCWGICPENAIEVPNMAEIQLKKAWWFQPEAGFTMPGGGVPGEGGLPGGGGPGEGGMLGHSLPGFRQLISPEEIGSRGQVMFFTEYPRVPLKKELWPYEIDEG
jgi:ferredoxin